MGGSQKWNESLREFGNDGAQILEALAQDRLPASQYKRLRELLREAGCELHDGPEVEARLSEIRAMYEPFVNALAQRLLFSLPPIVPERDIADNWQKSAWTPRTPGSRDLW